MKKIFACIFAIILIAALVACNYEPIGDTTVSIPTIPPHILPEGSMPETTTDNNDCPVETETLITEEVVPTTPNNTKPEHEHSLVEHIENETKPTCIINGGYDFVVCCSTCNEEISRTYIVMEAPGHIEVIQSEIAATCIANGKTEGKYCSVCNEILICQEDIPATGHSEVVNMAIQATCTTTGKTESIYCSTCNEILVESNIIPATGHTETTMSMIAATCTTAGKTEGTYCSECKEVLVAQEIIYALGHTTAITNATEATCTKDGNTEGMYCTVCNEVLVRPNTIKAFGHTASDEVRENFKSNGEYESVIYCSVCNSEMLRIKVTPPTVYIDPIHQPFHIDESIYEPYELEAVKWIVENLPFVEKSDVYVEPTFTLSKSLNGTDSYATYQKISSLFYLIYGEEEACDCVIDFVNTSDRNGNRIQQIRLRYHDIKRMAAIRDMNLAKIDDILRTIPVSTEEEMLRDISEYIRKSIVYTKGYYDVDDALSGKSVCNGYALLFNMMANRAGIVSDLCVGPSSNNNWHAWNRVTLNDRSYRFYDMTYYDGGYARPYYIYSKTAWDRVYIINDYSDCWNGQR